MAPRRGLFAVDADENDITSEFFFFTKLAVARGALPPAWDWAAYFKVCTTMPEANGRSTTTPRTHPAACSSFSPAQQP